MSESILETTGDPTSNEHDSPARSASVRPLDEASSQQASPAEPAHRRRRRRRLAQGPEASARAADGQQVAAPALLEQSDEALPSEGAPAHETRERPMASSLRDDGAPADIPPERLDLDGIKILNRLHRFGQQAYFVGGCVRDLLLDRPPKDFDICTSAHPGEVRSLFRNCRLVGRRFRLAHVFFRGGKLIEVSTFRANPIEIEEGEDLPEDLLITRDNVFGTAEEDSRRRDFTVNGLFYDVRLGRVIDFVDGLKDLRARLIRTIGPPEVRLREDPVRILRAVRFAARLGFDIDPATYAAMEGAVEDLPRCASPRLLEEIFRLLRGGTSRQAFELLDALGALRVLLPPVAEYLEQGGPTARRDFFERLGALDERIKVSPVDDSLIIAVLLSPLAGRLMLEDDRSASKAVDEVLDALVQTARLPRRIGDRARQLLWAQGILSGERRRRRSLASFRHHTIFPDALELFAIQVRATGQGEQRLAAWREGREPFEQAPPEDAVKKRRRRRRRPRGKHSDGGPPGCASDGGSTPGQA